MIAVRMVLTLDLLCRRFLLNTNVVHTFLNGGIKTEQTYCSQNSDWSVQFTSFGMTNYMLMPPFDICQLFC